MKKRNNNYYQEKNRAKRHAMNFIDEEFYNEDNIPRKIFLKTIKLDIALKFNCNYETIFLEIMTEYMKGDKRIKYDQERELWSIE